MSLSMYISLYVCLSLSLSLRLSFVSLLNSVICDNYRFLSLINLSINNPPSTSPFPFTYYSSGSSLYPNEVLPNRVFLVPRSVRRVWRSLSDSTFHLPVVSSRQSSRSVIRHHRTTGIVTAARQRLSHPSPRLSREKGVARGNQCQRYQRHSPVSRVRTSSSTAQ